MPTPAFERSPNLEDLLRHAEAVRRMLLEVLDPAVGADDLAQESFLRAWKKSGDPRRAHGAWWRTIAKNFALDVRRRSERRERRERACARNEAQPSAEDIVARTEAHRRVLERVLALDEPYRRVVLLRFFDGLEPREIAEATGQPEGTIRAQLHRALHLLRARFERDGSLRSDAALLLGLPLAPPLSSLAITGGTLAMSTATKGLIAAALIAVCTWWAWPAREPEIDRGMSGWIEAEASSAPPQVAAEQIERTAPDAQITSAVPSPDAQPAERLFHGRLISPRGAEFFSGTSAWIALEDGNGELLRKEVDEHGSFAIFDLPPGSYELATEVPAHRVLRARFEVAAEPAVQRRDFELRSADSIPVVVLDPQGAPLRELEIDRRSGTEWKLGIAVSRTPFERALAPSAWMRFEGNELGHFRERGRSARHVGTLEIHADYPLHIALLCGHAVLEQQVVQAAPEELKFELATASLERLQSKLRVRLVHASDGRPIDAVSWELHHLQGATSGQQPLRDGVLEIHELQPGVSALLLDVPHLAQRRRLLQLEPGAELDLGTLAMGAACGIRGRVLDADGRPIACKVLVHERENFRAAAHELGMNGASFHVLDGELAIEGLSAGRYYAQIEGPHQMFACFEFELGGVEQAPLEWRLPPVEPLDLRIDVPSYARWTLLVLDERGRPLAETSGKGVGEPSLRLAPGRAELLLRIEGRELQRFPLQVWRGESALVRIP